MKLFKKPIIKKLLISCMGFIFVLVSFPFIYRFVVQQYYSQKIYTVKSVAPSKTALVFGAGIYDNGVLSDMLRDRMDVAIALYDAGKVDKLLLSGDNRFENYNEPGAMMDYALRRGVAEADIQPDYGGRRTYDSCYRAKHIFQVEEVILVTQAFHLPRALMLCRQLGIQATGVASDLQPYLASRWLAVREIGATLQSGWDLIQKVPPPVMDDTVRHLNRRIYAQRTRDASAHSGYRAK